MEATMLTPLRDALSWAFWAWIASRWSGGGTGHPSYPYARWQAYTAKLRFQSWIEEGQ